MMTTRVIGLNEIARDDASPAEARDVLLSIFGQPTPDLLNDAYLALRSWVWKALDQRRRDSELRDWNDMLSATATLMANNGQPSLAERLRALSELVSESINVAETFGASDITKRQHVTKALGFLAESGGAANRSDIGRHLGLEQANLTRVLNMMSAAGLVERSKIGRESLFALLRAGQAAQRTQAVAR